MSTGMNPIKQVYELGQSIWLDFLRRNMLENGAIQKLIDEDGLKGMTSNPSIFEKAIAGSHDYENEIRTLTDQGKSIEEIYQTLVVQDIQKAADLFRPIYDQTEGQDGFISLEVSPYLAHDSERTIKEAHKLWSWVDRPNLMIKVPATKEGLIAIEKLIGDGININVTLLFGLGRYREVTQAYINGLKERKRKGLPLQQVASVASFFLSRIDVILDPILEKKMQESEEKTLASQLHGQAAVSSARIAYQTYKDIFHGESFIDLKAMGARPQRLLWASTSTKNPAYSDVKYVEDLIGPETVNTVPLGTLNAYRDHGNPTLRLEQNIDMARKNLATLNQLGIDLDQITQTLEDEGVKKFSDAFELLMNALEKEHTSIREEKTDPISFDLGKYEIPVKDRIQKMKDENFLERFWRKDPTLWKNDLENQKIIQNALGWMHVAEKMEDNLPEIQKFVETVKKHGYQHVVHMGMGGSSLTPLVFQRTFKVGQSGLPLTVLDTTDPITINNLMEKISIENTLFIVASKSGTTAEPLAFEKYFYARLKERKGEKAGDNFIAITDPGTKLDDMARENHYRHIFRNFVDIGGRYSALSYFGLVPAALMGLDVELILNRALRMAHACISNIDENTNLCLKLGAVLGEMGLRGRDKVTFVLPDSLAAFGIWLEQLLAESTGKEGRGLLPVAGEPLGEPDVYGDDRIFIYFRMKNTVDLTAARITSLREAGHPVVTIRIEDPFDLGQEFYRWEIATAIAGSVLGINAFNQPNVQESKDNTNKLISIVEKKGTVPEEVPEFKNKYLSVSHAPKSDRMSGALASFLKQSTPGDYIAIQAYLPENLEVDRVLQNLREELRGKYHLATTLGYGPRFLHSTGQYHKGGPNTGLFILLTDENPVDEKIPGEIYGFGEFKHAQAIGDLKALEKHGRRLIHLNLKWLTAENLQALSDLFERAMEN